MNPKFLKISPHTLILQWENPNPREIHACRDLIQKDYSEAVLETVPAFEELAIYLKLSTQMKEFELSLKANLDNLESIDQSKSSICYQIPLCYHADFSPDLSELARSNKLEIDEVISLHSNQEYLIHFLGFLPGFPYLSGLDPKLHKARLSSPQSEIPEGSVGIAGDQTGIYPQASPAGWNIIGRSPVKLYDIKKDPPALLESMQKLKFNPISKAEFAEIADQLKQGKYKIKRSDD